MITPSSLPPTTLATVARTIATTLQQSYGVDPLPVLKSVGIDPAVIHDSGLRLSITTLGPLWRHCVAITGDEAFGLRVARYLKPASLYGVDLALFVCTTLEEAAERLVQLLNVLSTVSQPVLVEDQAGDWRLEFHLNEGIRPEAAASDCFIYAQILLFERLCGKQPDQFLRQVEMRRAPPQDATKWQVMGSKVLFAQPIGALVFRREAFAFLLPGTNPNLQAQIEQPILQYLIQNGMPLPLGSLRAQLAGMLMNNPTLAGLAAYLGLSDRQLQGMLRKQQMTFSTLLDQTREAQVLVMLSIPELSLKEIAQRVGFSKADHLIRAFRRWQGMPPQKYRQQLSSPSNNL
ncbi:AraC family transcriptional regulator [Pseudomonas sp. H9]|uniref:AraC family transcriptional regulator n=1 Tax=Pseudomonas sp. H9 TaxID=483968 RepID=UPI001057FF74|nr:AraC family transcriptional regulator [Pseudomonas sp. H9]TDF86257.1 AraC family transcriptional regulator [Pseudomonas sp. H9]